MSMLNGGLDHKLELHILELKLRVTNIKKDAIGSYTHALIKIALLPHSCPKFFSFTETKGGYTVIVEDNLYSELPKGESIDVADPIWRVLTVSAGALGSHKLTGISKIVKTVISPLADNNISVLIISTYQSDYVLVKDFDLQTAIKCLSCNFKIFMETPSGLESIEVSIGDRMEGMLKKNDISDHRPIKHPLTCLHNRFHISSVDMQMVQTLMPIILDFMFYSSSKPKLAEGYEIFFHLSIVEGDITLVLDNESLSRFPSGSLHTSNSDECWRMLRIGDSPLGFDESGVAAQVAEPLADAQMTAYYISTYALGHTLIPEGEISHALEILDSLKVS
ncbi:cytosolic arginine sensor for mTORC1 subunit 1-like isoform X1 [Actinia tenebrosa]|uniref:Cytosolic arginine sensor for mTORC1 subunit 1-like isoform X1 n=1 Tax=Actinia tenebrosa TaxID=6105 RepID=A0A6P8HPE2_ACTTE|nr:cytosolic arginine sensor for mTORC1 subunit 1-like isoform X1 [Actinia tenebrosa]XP_031558259.1 cytosolic arginine sensor for mTORC1 subunit 1-like isoform X1 [Actinia tenebrosa]